MTLLQWTSAIVSSLWTATPPGPTQESPTSPAGDSWAEYRAFLNAILPIREDERSVALQGPKVPWNALAPQLNEENGLAIRVFYARAESILRSHSSAPPEAPQSSARPTVEASGAATTGYICHTRFGMKSVPAHLKVLYDELYEACWDGDNTTIQELCLPKNIREGKEPIQISVQTAALGGLATLTGMQ